MNAALTRYQQSQSPTEDECDVKWCPHEPTEMQSEFVYSKAREHGYGGAAGGGKSDAALIRVAKRINHPKYAALIMRRTLQELTKSDGLIPRSHEWWGRSPAKWHGQEKYWEFPSGARLDFGYCEGPFDHLRYQGSAYTDIVFEELTQFPEPEPYLYLYSRQRRLVGVDLDLFMGSTFNPGGPGHEWVKDRFLVNRGPKTVFTFAKLEDNPHLDEESYNESLSYLDPVTRAQLRHGDWEASPIGKYFRKDWFKFVSEAPPLTRWVRGWDTGASEHGDYTVGVLLGVFGRKLYIKDVVRGKWETPEVRQTIWDVAKSDGSDVTVAIEQAHCGIAAIQDLKRNPDLDSFNLVGVKVTKDKELRARGWRNRLGNGELYLIRGGWNDDFIEECLRFTNEKTNTDDQIDGTSVAFETVFRSDGGLAEQDDTPKRGSLAEQMAGLKFDDEEEDLD